MQTRQSLFALRVFTILLSLSVLALGVVACAPDEEDEGTGNSYARVEAVPGSTASRVTILPQAIEALKIQTAPVAETNVTGTAGPLRKIVPYSSLVYEPDGSTWVFQSEGSATYLRQRVTVDFIKGGQVVLLDGPATGTQVVVVGAAQLFGAESGVGGED